MLKRIKEDTIREGKITYIESGQDNQAEGSIPGAGRRVRAVTGFDCQESHKNHHANSYNINVEDLVEIIQASCLLFQSL